MKTLEDDIRENAEKNGTPKIEIDETLAKLKENQYLGMILKTKYEEIKNG